jgi:hypothetical protein
MSEENNADSEQVLTEISPPEHEAMPLSGQADKEQAQAPAPTGGPAKTQGVRATRADGGRRALERAAKAAARTGRRGDVHEYMRVRRGYV